MQKRVIIKTSTFTFDKEIRREKRMFHELSNMKIKIYELKLVTKINDVNDEIYIN